MKIGAMFDGRQPGHVFPESTFANPGAILCDRIADVAPAGRMGSTFSTYYHMGPLLPKGFDFENRSNSPCQTAIFASRTDAKQEYVDQDIPDGFGPSGIPPLVDFKLTPEMGANEREITDLLKAKTNEPPAMIEVALSDSRFRTVPRARSDLVIKRNGIDSYKGRLCVRWGTAPLETTAFVSPPTAHRCSVELICATSSQLQWAPRAIDISQEFLQSSNLHPDDRVIAIPPPMIHLRWDGKLTPMNHDVSTVTHNRGFLLLIPLYGGRDAPMRWFLALSKRLRGHGFTQMQTDVCIFSKKDAKGESAGSLIAHVDDLMFCGTPQFQKESIHAIQTFRTGEVETLTIDAPIIFTGLAIELDSANAIFLSQQMYAGELPVADVTEYLNGNSILNADALKSTSKQGLGSLIWLRQARPDIGFTATQMATQIVVSRESPEKARKLARLYNKIVRFAKNRQRGISYCKFHMANHNGHMNPTMFLGWELFVFTDAGFWTLVQNRSVESHISILCDVIDRGGIIRRHGLLSDHRCDKIHRVCRSTLAAEANAAATSVDVALLFQVLITDAPAQTFDYKRLTPPTEFPLMGPFRESPLNAEVKKEAEMGKINAFLITSHAPNPMRTETRLTFQATCHCCHVSMQLATKSRQYLNRDEQKIYGVAESHRPAVLSRPMVLADCCILYGAILRLPPKAAARCTRIAMAFLRDSLKLTSFSFAEATVNLGDVGTMRDGSMWAMGRFPDTSRFALSFVGRKKRE